MSEIIIKIKTDNAAFDGGAEFETAKILEEVAEFLTEFGMDEPIHGKSLFDSNGNNVGSVTFS